MAERQLAWQVIFQGVRGAQYLHREKHVFKHAPQAFQEALPDICLEAALLYSTSGRELRDARHSQPWLSQGWHNGLVARHTNGLARRFCDLYLQEVDCRTHAPLGLCKT
jgi:hypothetical protein